jgi:hypothetical protein
MKKSVILTAFAFSAASAFAQDLTSKKGFPILPEAGDYSISFDAVPFLNFVFDKTRIMSAAPASSAGGALNYSVPFTIVGKYMKDANTAYRGIVQIGFNRVSEDQFVGKVGSTTGETVTDNEVTSTSDIILGGGLQFYRGKGRLRGYYGGDGLLSIQSGPSKSYTYGNAINAENPVLIPREKEDKAGMEFGIRVRGFIGAEYFFAPKMSIGAEFGWGLGISSEGEGENTTEFWDGTAVKSNTVKTGGTSTFNMGVDNAGGAINLAIYF